MIGLIWLFLVTSAYSALRLPPQSSKTSHINRICVSRIIYCLGRPPFSDPFSTRFKPFRHGQFQIKGNVTPDIKAVRYHYIFPPFLVSRSLLLPVLITSFRVLVKLETVVFLSLIHSHVVAGMKFSAA